MANDHLLPKAAYFQVKRAGRAKQEAVKQKQKQKQAMAMAMAMAMMAMSNG
jgi:hypothetical protein